MNMFSMITLCYFLINLCNVATGLHPMELPMRHA